MTSSARRAANISGKLALSSDDGLKPEFWTKRSPERKLRAIQACQNYEAEPLVVLMDAFRQLDKGKDRKAPDGTKKSTQRVYSAGIRSWIEFAQERGIDILNPDQDEATEWIRLLEGPRELGGFAPATVIVRLSAVKWLYLGLRRIQATKARPFDDLKLAGDERAIWEKRDSYTLEECEKLISKAQEIARTYTTRHKAKAERLRVLAFAISLGVDAGLRASEIVMVQYRDVNRETRMLQVRRAKGGKHRQVAMLTRAVELFDLISPGSRLDSRIYSSTTSTLRREIKDLCLMAEVPYKGIHSLRHTHGERLARQGVSLTTVAAQLGHSSVTTTQVYVKLNDPAQVHEAFDQEQ